MDDKNVGFSTEGGSGSSDIQTGSQSFTESTIFNSTVVFPTTTATNWLAAIGFGLCDGKWLHTNHILFQIANAFLFLAYVAPPGLHGVLYMRICLMFGCMFLALWGWIIVCAFDSFLWNAIFTFINFIHVIIILYILRPVRFKKDLEEVFQDLFKPLRVTRHEFKKTLRCMKEIQMLKPREAFCIEKVTRADKLTLLLSGRLLVSQGGHTLHVIEKHQFLDSPEWFGVSSDEFYQTTILALEESQVLVWNRDKLRLSISNDQFLQAILDNILGKDVVKKLLLVTESSCNGSTSTHATIGEIEGTSETAKLLQESKVVGSNLVLGQQIEILELKDENGIDTPHPAWDTNNPETQQPNIKTNTI